MCLIIRMCNVKKHELNSFEWGPYPRSRSNPIPAIKILVIEFCKDERLDFNHKSFDSLF